MVIEKISVKTLRQEVYDQLRDKIISADILPGETISLRELAQKFGVSLMPVREALWQLESERIIVIESNKRIRVNTLTAKEMEEALRLRLMLESTAADRACDLRPESALPKLRKQVEALQGAEDRPKVFMRKNSLFHISIYSLADSPLLLEMIERLMARVGPYVYTYAIAAQNNMRVRGHHEKMYQGMAERNKKMITEALREDLEAAARLIIPVLEQGARKKINS
jgi:DNA-binding GntR family transcriptional regulator